MRFLPDYPYAVCIFAVFSVIFMSVLSTGANGEMTLSLKANWTRGTLPWLSDVNNDNVSEIITTFDFNQTSNVTIWNGSGTALAGWPVHADALVDDYPTVGDIDGDKNADVVFGDGLGTLYAYHSNGTLMWFNDNCSAQTGYIDGLIDSRPVLADVHNDTLPEIVFSCKFYNFLTYPYSMIYVLDMDGNTVSSWKIGTSSGGGATGSPAVSDINGDEKPEIVVVGGSFMTPFFVQAFNSDGTEHWAGPVYPDGYLSTQAPPIYESPVIGDIDGDNDKEILVASYNDSYSKIYLINSSGAVENSWKLACVAPPETLTALIDGSTRIISYCNDTVYAWNGTGSPLWNYTVGLNLGTEGEHYPAVGDINNDNHTEMVVPAGQNLIVLSGSGSLLINMSKTFEDFPVGGVPLKVFGYYLNTPVIGDVDGDSKNETVLSAQSKTAAGLEEIFVFVPCPDNDSDGYNSSSCGGSDCDDSNPAIHPGAADICGNGIDEDCSGSDSACPPPPPSGGGGPSGGGPIAYCGDGTLQKWRGEECEKGVACNGTGLVCNVTTCKCMACQENWSCSEWGECSPEGVQARACTDKSSCGTIKNKPSVSQPCTYAGVTGPGGSIPLTPPVEIICGNGNCEEGETCETCPDDCGQCGGAAATETGGFDLVGFMTGAAEISLLGSVVITIAIMIVLLALFFTSIRKNKKNRKEQFSFN